MLSSWYCSTQFSHSFPLHSTHQNGHCLLCNSFHSRCYYSAASHHVGLCTGEAFGFEGLGQTYLSLDVDGRVVRLDSFSKFLAPGMRLGWVTAHPDMLQKICFALHASTMGPCSFTQVQWLHAFTCSHACIHTSATHYAHPAVLHCCCFRAALFGVAGMLLLARSASSPDSSR